MSGNTFGELFKVTTFGESHGAAVGAVIDGVPAGLKIDAAFIQSELDRRRPGQSTATSARSEADRVEILSGVLDGVALGTPLALLIRNGGQHSSDYETLKGIYRPGHADFTYDRKFGFRDARGGGRSSGRETAARVAAAAVAKLLLRHYGVVIRAGAEAIGGISAERFRFEETEKNAVRSLDPDKAELMMQAIRAAAQNGDSTGGIVRVRITGVPAGWGAPVFDKLDAHLASAMIGLGAVKGIEFGDGFAVAAKRGSENNDAPLPDGSFAANHSGGILGGISNGMPIEFRLAVKPTPSIAQKQSTVNRSGEAVELAIKGRHDPCIVPRIVPVVEAMAALVLADFALLHRSDRLEF